MEFDVVIVGAGPAGLAAAIRIKQLAAEKGEEVSVVVLEKGSEVGASCSALRTAIRQSAWRRQSSVHGVCVASAR